MVRAMRFGVPLRLNDMMRWESVAVVAQGEVVVTRVPATG